MESSAIYRIKKLGFTWETGDPFLFCVHHNDAYPEGNENLEPAVSLAGRNLGNDFTLKDGWRMYHGHRVPGFPMHPHRGFETVTIVLQGFIDHSDSAGAAGRYGNGDVQWMTAGEGLQHSEMFPLLKQDQGNPLELFQIWLNLPENKKFVKPYFKMLWAEDIPHHVDKDNNGQTIEVIVVAGEFKGVKPPQPAPDSWAADPENEVAIWLIRMEPGANWNLPAASQGLNRTLFFYKGDIVNVEGQEIRTYHSAELKSEKAAIISNGNSTAHLLILQGRPINEPVVQYGPFVMNSQSGIQQAFSDFRRTQFGGWPWPRPDNVHDRSKGRFAKYADGLEEIK